MLFNCCAPACALHDPAHTSVDDILGLRPPAWPNFLGELELLGRRELCVPLQPGLAPSVRTANVLVIQLLHVRESLNCVALSNPLLRCNAVTNPTDSLDGFRRASISSVATGGGLHSFVAWPENVSWSIHQLSGVNSYLRTSVMQGLREAAEALLLEITDHMSGMRATNKKPYERDYYARQRCSRMFIFYI